MNSSDAKALARQDADFDLRLIEPTSMSGHVVNRESVPDFATELFAEQSLSDLRR
jgi:hypothetical protein